MSLKGKLMMQWVLITLMSLQFLYMSLVLGCGDEMNVLYLNYPQEYKEAINILIYVSLLGMLIKKSRFGAGLLQIIILMGSAYFHFVAGQLFHLLLNIGAIGLCTIIIWLEQDRLYYSIENSEKS